MNSDGKSKKIFFNLKKENNRMGKTKALLKKIRNTKGALHSNMAAIKDRSGKELITVAEETKKR